jgi:hypothetical protein
MESDIEGNREMAMRKPTGAATEIDDAKRCGYRRPLGRHDFIAAAGYEGGCGDASLRRADSRTDVAPPVRAAKVE